MSKAKQANLKFQWLNPAYIALFLVNLIIAIGYFMVSTTLSLYVTGFGAGTAIAGAVVGAMSLAALFVRPFSGMLSDRMNKKRLLLLSLAGTGLAMTGYGLTQSIPVIMMLRMVHGVAFSLASTVTMALLAQTLPGDNMAQGMGLFAVGQTMASAFAPGLGLWIGEVLGFQRTFIISALLIVLAMGLAAITIKANERITHHDKIKLRISDFVAKEAIPYGLLAIIISGASAIENSFVALYGITLALGNVGWYFTIGAVILFITRLGGGWLADRYVKQTRILGFLAIAGAFWLLGLSNPANGVALFALAAVLKALGVGTLQPSLQAASLKAVDASRHGVAACTYYLGADIGQALSPMLGGAAVASIGYSSTFLIFSIPALIGMIHFLLKRQNIQHSME